MLRRCWLVVSPVGDCALFLTQSRAENYVVDRNGGHIVQMYGQDHLVSTSEAQMPPAPEVFEDVPH